MRQSITAWARGREICVLAALLFLVGCGGGEQSAQSPTPKFLATVVAVNGTATFSGKRANYTITRSANGFTVVDSTGVDGTTNLTNVSTLKFTDSSVDLTAAYCMTKLSDADQKMLIELYGAFFNRVPDGPGIKYWCDQLYAGLPLTSIADSFYSAALQYSVQTGYSANMTNADFVSLIYKNVLGRTGATAPPKADIDYWVGELTSGRATKASLVSTMLSAAHSFANDPTWGWVPQLLDNKYTVAKYFAVQQGLSYLTAEDSITKTMAIAAAVTSTSTTAATALVSVPDSAFNMTQVVASEQTSFNAATAGVWSAWSGATEAPVVIRLDGKGNYLMGQANTPSPGGQPGMERGTLYYDPLTKRITAKVLQDTNGQYGFSNPNAEDLTNTITIEGSEVVQRSATGVELTRFKKIANDNGSIVGAWANDVGGVMAVQLFVFYADGRVMMIDGKGDTDPNPCGGPGIEYGTYTFSSTTGLRMTGISVDTNGCAGLNEPPSSKVLFNPNGEVIPLVLSADGQTISAGDASFRRVSK